MCWLREVSALVLEPGSVGSEPQGCDLEGAKAGSGPPLVKEFQGGVKGTKDPEVNQLRQSLVMGPTQQGRRGVQQGDGGRIRAQPPRGVGGASRGCLGEDRGQRRDRRRP